MNEPLQSPHSKKPKYSLKLLYKTETLLYGLSGFLHSSAVRFQHWWFWLCHLCVAISPHRAGMIHKAATRSIYLRTNWFPMKSVPVFLVFFTPPYQPGRLLCCPGDERWNEAVGALLSRQKRPTVTWRHVWGAAGCTFLQEIADTHLRKKKLEDWEKHTLLRFRPIHSRLKDVLKDWDGAKMGKGINKIQAASKVLAMLLTYAHYYWWLKLQGFNRSY